MKALVQLNVKLSMKHLDKTPIFLNLKMILLETKIDLKITESHEVVNIFTLIFIKLMNPRREMFILLEP